MSGENETRALLTTDGRVLVQQPDGSYREVSGESDWASLDRMPDEEIERIAKTDDEAPPLTPSEWGNAEQLYPPPRERVTLDIDWDLIVWLKRDAARFSDRVNQALREYYERFRGPSG